MNKIAGHQRCIICHPDLNKKFAKHNMKGMKRVKHSIAVKMQESEFLLDLIDEVEHENTSFDD